ncbi:unnamed protein product [Closterium sp. NIES-54]
MRKLLRGMRLPNHQWPEAMDHAVMLHNLHCSVPIPIDDENPRKSVNAETYFDFADTGYVTPQPVDTNISERIGPNFLPDPEAGDEVAYPEDTNLPRYTQSGLQILGLVTAVHGAEPPKEPATIQQALGGGDTGKNDVKPWTKS